MTDAASKTAGHSGGTAGHNKSAAGLELLTIEEAAGLLSMSRSTLAAMRMRGDGPPFVKAGRHIRYRRSDLAAWTRSRTYISTSGRRPAGQDAAGAGGADHG